MKKSYYVAILLLVLTSFVASFSNSPIFSEEEILPKEPPILYEQDIDDPLGGITLNSDYIVVGEVTDITYEHVGRSPYTIYKISVEKVIKGAPDTKEVFFRLWGGPRVDGGWAELVGQDSYRKGDRILAFLANESNGAFNDVEVHWVWGDVIKSDPKLEDVICRVAKIMRRNNLQVGLSPHEAGLEIALPVRLPEGVDLPESLEPKQGEIIDSGWLTIMTENFEGDFPGDGWTLSGNPTWGKVP